MFIFALETLSINHKSALRVVPLYLDQQSPSKDLARKTDLPWKKKFIFLAINFIFSLWLYGQSQDSIAHTLLVADYDYTCHTLNAQGKKVEVKYGLTTQIAQHLARTMGYKQHKGENNRSEQLLYVPTTWQNYPQGQMTSVETIPPYQYLTTEKMPSMKWQLLADRDTICGYICQKSRSPIWWKKVGGMVCRTTPQPFRTLATPRTTRIDFAGCIGRWYSSFWVSQGRGCQGEDELHCARTQHQMWAQQICPTAQPFVWQPKIIWVTQLTTSKQKK